MLISNRVTNHIPVLSYLRVTNVLTGLDPVHKSLLKTERSSEKGDVFYSLGTPVPLYEWVSDQREKTSDLVQVPWLWGP